MSAVASLSALCEIQSGGTPSRAKREFYDGTIPWAKISDLEAANGLLLKTEEAITELGLEAIRGRLFPVGTLLFAIYGSIGKMAFAGREVSCNQAILGIQNRSNGVLSDRYLYHWLASKQKELLDAGQGIAQKNLSAGYLRSLQIPLPPLDEQKRIAAILDKADQLRQKRRQAIAMLDSLTQSVFLEMFGDPVSNSKRWDDQCILSDVADIGSGITKGRPSRGQAMRVVPYLAVANVQDRALNLKSVKDIEATEDEIARYRILKDDLLVTEGGDPDKLGRGTLWSDELPEVIHQNHIFRIRFKDVRVSPLFANWLIGSERGKNYFLRSAKQTTGIASINKTQLSNFPMLLPPVDLQLEFAEKTRNVASMQTKLNKKNFVLDALFSSLQYRAFSGQL